MYRDWEVTFRIFVSFINYITFSWNTNSSNCIVVFVNFPLSSLTMGSTGSSSFGTAGSLCCESNGVKNLISCLKCVVNYTFNTFNVSWNCPLLICLASVSNTCPFIYAIPPLNFVDALPRPLPPRSLYVSCCLVDYLWCIHYHDQLLRLIMRFA